MATLEVGQQPETTEAVPQRAMERGRGKARKPMTERERKRLAAAADKESLDIERRAKLSQAKERMMMVSIPAVRDPNTGKVNRSPVSLGLNSVHYDVPRGVTIEEIRRDPVKHKKNIVPASVVAACLANARQKVFNESGTSYDWQPRFPYQAEPLEG